MPAASAQCGEDLLAALAAPESQRDGGLTASRLAAITGRDRGLTARVVEDLLALDLVERDTTTRRLRLGWGLYAAAARVVEGRLAGRGQPVLDRLARGSGESAYLVVRHGTQSVTLAEAVPDKAVQGVSWVGRSVPVVRGDAGPVLLSDLDPVAIRELIGPEPLPPAPGRRAPKTTAGVLRLVARARGDGYGVLDEHVEPAAASISAPVHDFRGRLAGAVVVVGPSSRVRNQEAAIRDAVLLGARQLTESLGGGAG